MNAHCYKSNFTQLNSSVVPPQEALGVPVVMLVQVHPMMTFAFRQKNRLQQRLLHLSNTLKARRILRILWICICFPRLMVLSLEKTSLFLRLFLLSDDSKWGHFSDWFTHLFLRLSKKISTLEKVKWLPTSNTVASKLEKTLVSCRLIL